MTNLRLQNITVVNSSEIEATFTTSLSKLISIDNISIVSQTLGTPDAQILGVRIIDNLINITTQPLTNLSIYLISFHSTQSILFTSLHNDAALLEDGIANQQIVIGPIEDSNVVKSYFDSYLRDNVYDTTGNTTLNKHLTILATILSKSLFDIRQARNDNYLSFTVLDEPKIRDVGGFDRLAQESAYEILRVGRTPAGTTGTLTLTFDEFPTDPITLLQQNANENLTVSSSDTIGTFNLNTLTLNLSNKNITKLLSITFTYSNGHLPYTYDISKFGYQLLESKYDSLEAFTYLQLLNNQIRLNNAIIEDNTFSLKAIFQVQVSYQYKDLGKFIDQSTVVVNSVLSSGREVLPPLKNIFNLKHAPVVDANNVIGAVGDITFVDQNVLAILNQKHPAFITELPFRLDFLPSIPGQYAVDYDTGTVYVFGNDGYGTGTGATPPLAIYNYRLVFTSNIDYVLDENDDLAALPNGNIVNSINEIDITFSFEKVLAQNVDYIANLHTEVLNERINNNFTALNSLRTQFAPITNVFKIYNETSGEVYKLVRWNNDKVFYSFNTPPTIEEITGERATFELINNEIMLVNQVINSVIINTQIYKILLNNNNIMAQSQDCIGSIFNSSVSISDRSIFIQEKYFDYIETLNTNITRLTTVGDFLIDYANGIIYLLTSTAQTFDIGAVSYRCGTIILEHPHITSVEDIFYRILLFGNKNKHFDYISFEDTQIIPKTFDRADEQVLNDNTTTPYIISSQIIGAFVNAQFVGGVSNSINFIRSIFENSDLQNNTLPINFTSSSSFVGQNITVSPLTFTEYHSVDFDGTNFFITLNTGSTYLSPNISINISVFRLADSTELWDGSGTVVPGNLITLLLPNTMSPALGDSVRATYTFTINDLSHIIVDYDKGGYYLDYTAITDEVLVSYEYGDNTLDFRTSTALNTGDQYFVSYKVGALRNTLLQNFGSLINIDILNQFEISLNRERYRDALMAAMHTFPKGPTSAAIQELVSTITHVPPEIIELVFQSWSLGNSLLQSREAKIDGDVIFVPTKFGNGALIDDFDQQISFPAPANLKLENGTLETWITPKWDGIDNFADLTFSISKDGYALADNQIFLGALEYHPILDGYDSKATSFTINKFQQVNGLPSKNKNGVFIYYDLDITGLFHRWFVDVIDGYFTDGFITDGYVNKNYQVNISCNGKFYDTKSTLNPQPSSSRITSANNTIAFHITSFTPNEGITFVADIPHYIVDFAEDINHNRLSIFKDEAGYLNFKVFDKFGNSYLVSTDISSWRYGVPHHIAAGWKIDTKLLRDELHLFVDGTEVSNIIKYGDRIVPYLHEKYRTVNPEEVVGIIIKDIVASTDLITTFGSNLVSSSLNFSLSNIMNGDIIYIEEANFDVNGYTITNVNGNVLTLGASMPFSITNGKFSVNKTSFPVQTEVDIYPNIAISLIHSDGYGSDGYTTDGYDTIGSLLTNFITAGVQVGDLIRINDPAFQKHYIILDVLAHSIIVNDLMPSTASGLQFFLYPNTEEEIPGLRALRPAYELSESLDGYFTDVVSIRDKALANDIVLLRTLGLNHRRIRRQYYVWGNNSNLLKTKLPSPISLNETNIYRVLLPRTSINSSNSTLGGGGVWTSNNITTDQPSNSIEGRTLAVSIGTTNTDFTTPTTVDIYGMYIDPGTLLPAPIVETLSFDKAETLYTLHKFISDGYIQVHTKPINASQTFLLVDIKERYSITRLEHDLVPVQPNAVVPQPVIRFSYQRYAGSTLFSDGYQAADGYVVTDAYAFFSSALLDDYLIIYTPSSVAGYYKIIDISSDHKSLTIASIGNANVPVSAFTDGKYEIIHTIYDRSGLQNGYFTFEYVSLPGQPYFLLQGLYELDYYTYLNIPFDMHNSSIIIGNNFEQQYPLNGTVDEFQISSLLFTDTRIGEIVSAHQHSITKDFNSIHPPVKDINTLVLQHFDVLPLVNDADVFITADRKFIQADVSVNENFEQSICFTDRGLTIENDGIIDPRKAGTIEFWVNPLFDTNNDPNTRYYFDASNAVSESLTSATYTTIVLNNPADSIISVALQTDQTINFATRSVLQADNKTISLNQPLPHQNTPVIITYIPLGFQGDRVSIFKDDTGFINFLIIANQQFYQLRAATVWPRNSWHRVKASFTANKGHGQDEMHLFLDGYERSNFTFGSSLTFSNNASFGSSFIGPNPIRVDIPFKDNINQFSIGANFSNHNAAFALIDNLRISNIARPMYQPFGSPLDANYTSNISMAFPVTEDLYTTLLLNFDTIVQKTEDFAILRNKHIGLSDFEINIFDSLDIIKSDSRIKDILQALISALKPANSRAFLAFK